MSTPSDKSARFDRVAHAVIRAILRHGVDHFTIATVARWAEVSRAWIYKYFGSGREELVAFAARHFGEQFAELRVHRPAESVAAWRDTMYQATVQGLHDIDARPWMIQVRFQHRTARDPLGEVIREVEQRHEAKLRAELPPTLARHPRMPRLLTLITESRMGVFHWWADPAVRAEHTVHDVATDLMLLVDGALARVLGAPDT